MVNKIKHKLELLKVGDKITFPQEDVTYVVKKVGFRYKFAVTEDGCYYTVIDTSDKILASTNRLIEWYGNFNKEGHADELEKLLHSGEVGLSQKYVTTFKEFNLYGGKVL